jgi:hypothetical protein
VWAVLIQISWELVCKLFIWFLGQLRIWVTWGQKLCHTAQMWKNLFYTLEVTFWLNCHQTWSGCLSKTLLRCSWWVRGAILFHIWKGNTSVGCHKGTVLAIDYTFYYAALYSLLISTHISGGPLNFGGVWAHRIKIFYIYLINFY